MKEDSAKNEIIELEQQFWQALKDKDGETASRLCDEPSTVIGAQGVGQLDRQALKAMLESANWDLNNFALQDVSVRLVTDDVAVATYTVREELTVDGKPVTLEAADASTWVRRDGQWLCALHTESITGDPFGRDRRA